MNVYNVAGACHFGILNQITPQSVNTPTHLNSGQTSTFTHQVYGTYVFIYTLFWWYVKKNYFRITCFEMSILLQKVILRIPGHYILMKIYLRIELLQHSVTLIFFNLLVINISFILHAKSVSIACYTLTTLNLHVHRLWKFNHLLNCDNVIAIIFKVFT